VYVTVEEFREFAAGVGVTLPDNDDECLVMLTKASLFIDSQDDRLCGTRAVRDQEHAYPRKNLVLQGWQYEADEIPNIVKQCQMSFALEINSGIDIFAPRTELPVIREKVDVLEVQYASPTEVKATERESFAMDLLRQLICEMGGSGVGFLNAVRT